MLVGKKRHQKKTYQVPKQWFILSFGPVTIHLYVKTVVIEVVVKVVVHWWCTCQADINKSHEKKYTVVIDVVVLREKKLIFNVQHVM